MRHLHRQPRDMTEPSSEPDFGSDEHISAIQAAESGCEFCGQDHLTKKCPHNPDSHIRKMTNSS